ncbi:HAMP domain-containing histidine kinase [Peribacillus cavernae]|uniref:histidine kinase n=2 Tax=Peribacillus cavernae TaxID=1674310 RepID=A0A3S0TXU4_9BACI|nr:signal transduction histidine kinase [Peribacillus cavernae]RUQ26596.1 HAMP domain-containing histidine kinase [Peribacillus cavernae]
MFMKTEKRTTLLRYWTTRYLLTLCVGLLLLAVVSMWWMQQTALEYRLNLLKYLADETSDRAIKDNGQVVIGPILWGIIDDREKILHLNKEPIIYLTDPKGQISFTKPQIDIKEGENHIQQSILDNKDSIQKVELKDGNEVYVVKSPINYAQQQIGWVIIVQEEDSLKEVNQDHGLLAIMLCGLGILGWAVIYVLSRKISKPIRDVAKAAVQIREGNYDIELYEDAREEEIYELIQSFKEMTNRLTQLEKLRAELFAGVTHDLKTPVTSISGLVQAVKDDVVTGGESKEFLEISLKEIRRLQTMIEDLLDFNAISSGAFTIKVKQKNLNELIEEIAYQWKVTQEDQHFNLDVKVPEKVTFGLADPLRLQEIIINLLNNAKQALAEDGNIEISLYKGETSKVNIDVKDNGKGIPLNEQRYIFEPFYRGEKKKLKVRGLGLGLPFSRMLAKAQKGDLVLKKSSENGTIFTITLMGT